MCDLSQLPKISPIIKPVSARCNLNCRYCYYKNTHNSSKHGLLMDETVLRETIQQVIAVAQIMDIKAEFTWHGGEPTLAGLGFYKKVIALQKELLETIENDIPIDNSIQTNGTRLDEEWCEFLSGNGFSVGLSLDGPALIHDRNRFYASGRGSFEEVLRTVHLLQKYKIGFGVIGVVTEASIGQTQNIFDFFVQNGITRFDLAPCAELPNTYKSEKFTIEADQYADFMIDLFNTWLSRDDPEIHIRFLENALQGFMGAVPGLCSMGRNYCGVFPNILPNGDVYFCDNYEGSEDMIIGNIMFTPLYDLIAEGSCHSKFRRQIYAAKEECRNNCEWYIACGGGCPRYKRTSPHQPFEKDNFFCEAYKKILSHVYLCMNSIMETAIIKTQQYKNSSNESKAEGSRSI